MGRLKIFLIAVTMNNDELIMQINRTYLFIIVWSCDIIWCPEDFTLGPFVGILKKIQNKRESEVIFPKF